MRRKSPSLQLSVATIRLADDLRRAVESALGCIPGEAAWAHLDVTVETLTGHGRADLHVRIIPQKDAAESPPPGTRRYTLHRPSAEDR